jgi:hypothetical protein
VPFSRAFWIAAPLVATFRALRRQVLALIVLAFLCAATPAFGQAKNPVEADATAFVRALQSREPAVTTIQTYTDATDPNHLLGRPGQYTSKVNFVDSRLAPPSNPALIDVNDGGSVEAFRQLERPRSGSRM